MKRRMLVYVKKDSDGGWEVHSLEDHLVVVAGLASEMAKGCGMNDLCLCGSGKKYKKCCGAN